MQHNSKDIMEGFYFGLRTFVNLVVLSGQEEHVVFYQGGFRFF